MPKFSINFPFCPLTFSWFWILSAKSQNLYFPAYLLIYPNRCRTGRSGQWRCCCARSWYVAPAARQSNRAGCRSGRPLGRLSCCPRICTNCLSLRFCPVLLLIGFVLLLCLSAIYYWNYSLFLELFILFYTISWPLSTNLGCSICHPLLCYWVLSILNILCLDGPNDS